MGWALPEPETYSLQFSESNNKNYITEKNRNEVKNGSILKLEHSPSKTAGDILAKLNDGTPEEKTIALEKLSSLALDITFAHEFINKQGLALIISQVCFSDFLNVIIGFSLNPGLNRVDFSSRVLFEMKITQNRCS